MSDGSSIEWTNATWNPVRGCSRVSPGCVNCYAERQAIRHSGRGGHYEGLVDRGALGTPRWTGMMRTLPDKLDEPLRWKKPRRIFVNSMSDLFHDGVPDEFIDRVFDVIWQTPQHTYQVLTKRPERAVKYMRERAYRRRFGWVDRERTPLTLGETIHYDDIVMRNQCGYMGGDEPWSCTHPDKGGDCGREDSCQSRECPIAETVDDRETLEEIGVADEYQYDAEGYAEDCEWMRIVARPKHARPGNLWLGFSAENQEMFTKRAAIFSELRHDDPFLSLFCSMEPLLGPISTRLTSGEGEDASQWSPLDAVEFRDGGGALKVPYLNWVIVGGESGPGARPCDVAWVRSLVEQCRAAGVACFVKQLGAAVVSDGCTGPGQHWPCDDAGKPLVPRQDIGGAWRHMLRSRKGGDMQEWPRDLRVREFPAAGAVVR